MALIALHRNKGRLQKQMQEENYCIVRNFLPFPILDRDVEALKNKVVASSSCVLQQIGDPAVNNDHRTFDENRLRLCIDYKDQDEFLRKVSDVTAALIDELFGKKLHISHIQSPASVLFSKEGCGPQELHSDFDPNKPAARKSFCLIVFLEDGGKLQINRGAQLLEPSFSKGDVVILRGDKRYRDSAYDCENLRIHYFFESEEGARPREDSGEGPFVQETTSSRLLVEQLTKPYRDRKKETREMRTRNIQEYNEKRKLAKLNIGLKN